MKSKSPLAYLVKRLYGSMAPLHFAEYQIWGALCPDIFTMRVSSRPSAATTRSNWVPGKQLRALDMPDDSRDVGSVKKHLDQIVSVRNPPMEFGEGEAEPTDAIAQIVDSLFGNAVNNARERTDTVDDDYFDAVSVAEELDKLFLQENTFREAYQERLAAAFPKALDSDFDTFWAEFDALHEAPFFPTKARILALSEDEWLNEMRDNLNRRMVFLLLASYFGPDSYFEHFGLTPLRDNDTPIYSAVPSKKLAYVAQLVPVTMKDASRLGYITHPNGKAIPLDDQGAVYVLGRNPGKVARTGGAEIKSISVQDKLVSRLHAEITFSEYDGWCLLDGSAAECADGQSAGEGEGSKYGTLVMRVDGNMVNLSAEKIPLRHGDIICLAPDYRKALGVYEYVPRIGVDGISFRYETTIEKRREE